MLFYQLPARYAFHYEVSNPTDGDMKSHSETRDGDDVTGEYSVLQPDGCIRHVRYRAGKAGFFPEVRYEGNCDPRFYTAPKAGPENIGFATNEVSIFGTTFRGRQLALIIFFNLV